MVAVLRFTFSKDLKFIVRLFPIISSLTFMTVSSSSMVKCASRIIRS
jgi:hypothetical protein